MSEKKYINNGYPHFLHGADYNPEQWKGCEEVLCEDMRLFRLARMNELTVGVFSWAEIEAREGEFDFSFMDRVFDDVEAAGGRIILATPSGARPRWLAEKYPEVLRTSERREKQLFGRRHNHCLSSPVYREKVGIINRKLAERYGHRDVLYAWHIGNEFNGECHCEKCRAAFVEWCREKYDGDIEKLNHEWWTAFWSHRYSSFEEIEPPSSIGENLVHGLTLDWRRFCTHQTSSFIRDEQKPIKELCPHVPTTTNLMGLPYSGLDIRELAHSVDFVSWDNYPEWSAPCGDVAKALETAFAHDYTRGLTGENFLLMESTPSNVNWKEINPLKRPGIHFASSLQAVAHGSESVQYFQFRKSRGCSEKMHGAVVDHVGHEHTRVFSEIQEVGIALEKIDEICGTSVKSDVPVVRDIENLWALGELRGMQRGDKGYDKTCISHYAPMWHRGINTDVISIYDDFTQYKLVILPMLYMMREETAEKIEKYVREGGYVIATYTLGQANENDLVHLGGFPCGKLKDVFGIWAEEIDTLYPDARNHVRMGGVDFAARDYCEIIHTRGAEAIAHYTSDFYSGMPAATVNCYGDGRAYYVAFRDADGAFTDALISSVLSELDIHPPLDIADIYGVTAHSRECADAEYIFVECYLHSGARVELGREYYSMLDGRMTDTLIFERAGVAVLKRKKNLNND